MEELQNKILEEVTGLKDLFLRRLLDDKVKMASIAQLKENNEGLLKQLDNKAIKSMVTDLILMLDRIESQESADELIDSIKYEVLEILARREFYVMDNYEMFDPLCHTVVATVPADEQHKDKEIVKVIRNGYFMKEKVFRPASVVIAVEK